MSEHDIDSQLKEVLDLLRPVPERNPDARHRSRSRFNADLDAFFPAGAAYSSAPVARPEQAVLRPAAPVVRSSAAARSAAAARPASWYSRPLFAYLALSLLLVVAMFGGGAITVFAAGSALPGDTLYPVKLSAEQAQISLAADPARQAELYLAFAQKRLEEMNALAALGQYDAVGPLAMRFSHNVALASEKAERASARDPERALRIKTQAAQSLGMLRDNFTLVILKAPPALQASLKTALDQALMATPTVEPPPAANENKGGGGGGGNANNNGNPGGGNPNLNPTPVGGTTVTNANTNTSVTTEEEKVKDKDKDKEEKDKDKDKEEKDKDK